MGEILHFQRFSPRNKGSKPHIGLLSLEGSVLHQEDEPTKHLALKASGVYFWKRQRAVRNRDSTLKGCTQKSQMLWDPGQKQ